MTLKTGPDTHPLQGIAIGRPSLAVKEPRVLQVFWMTSGREGSQPVLIDNGGGVSAQLVYDAKDPSKTISYPALTRFGSNNGFRLDLIANGAYAQTVINQMEKFGVSVPAAIARYHRENGNAYPDCNALYVSGTTRRVVGNSIHTIHSTGISNGRLVPAQETYTHAQIVAGTGFAIRTEARTSDIEGIAPIVGSPETSVPFGDTAEETAERFLGYVAALTPRRTVVAVKEFNPEGNKVRYAFREQPGRGE